MDKMLQQDNLRRELAILAKNSYKLLMLGVEENKIKDIELPPEILLKALSLGVYDNARLNQKGPQGLYAHKISFFDGINFVSYTPQALIDIDNMQELPGKLEGKWEEG